MNHHIQEGTLRIAHQPPHFHMYLSPPSHYLSGKKKVFYTNVLELASLLINLITQCYRDTDVPGFFRDLTLLFGWNDGY